MSEDLFNRAALVPGMDISRMTPSLVSKGIVLRTQGWRVLRSGTGLSHDAKLIRTGRNWYVGDMLMGKPGQLTPLEDWEDDMRFRGVRVVVCRPIGVSEREMAASAWYWQTHFSGITMYDSKAIRHLLFFYATAELLGIRLGDEDRMYCTESCKTADVRGGGYDPYRKANGYEKINPTPGTKRKRIVGPWKTFEVVTDALTEAGKKYLIQTQNVHHGIVR